MYVLFPWPLGSLGSAVDSTRLHDSLAALMGPAIAMPGGSVLLELFTQGHKRRFD